MNFVDHSVSCVALLLVVSPCSSVSAGEMGGETVEPDFARAEFTQGTAISHPYFPLEMGYGAVIRAVGSNENGNVVTEESWIFFAGPGRNILGVQTTTLRDLAFRNGVLIEDTLDYFAQDSEGNVWYMGEDVKNYVYDSSGKLISTNRDSAWIAGENRARPGWIMPAQPQKGQTYFQEIAPADAALDKAKIWNTMQTITSGRYVFPDSLVVYETNALDPGAREFKYYARGVGLIRVDEDLDADLANPKMTFELTTFTHAAPER